MDERDYRPNSHKYKEQQKNASDEKRVEKVVQGKVKVKKKTEVRKFADVFVAEDAHNVKDYLLMEVAIPAIKNTIIDLITNGVTMLFNGESSRSSSSRRRSGDYVSYRDYSSRDRDRGRDRRDSSVRSRFDFDDLVFGNRADAEATLEQMDEMIDRYGWATVLDLYESADLGGSAPWTANKYGWNSLRSADVVRVRDGYVIKLPKAQPLD